MDAASGSGRARHPAPAGASSSTPVAVQNVIEGGEAELEEEGGRVRAVRRTAANQRLQTHRRRRAASATDAHAATPNARTDTHTPTYQTYSPSAWRRDNQLHQQVTPHVSHHTPHQQNAPAPPAAVGPMHPFRLHRTAHFTGTRLSMPFDSDESSLEPDLSVLAMTRARHDGEPDITATNDVTYDEETTSQEQYEAEGSSIEEQPEAEDDGDAETDDIGRLADPAEMGLKEISNLGRFTVSSHKPGNGVEELRSDDLKLYWQSDGPQPHKLTVYFVKRVGIRDIRFFVDYNEDESYTPTKIVFKSGTSENNLIEFATMAMDSPIGWQQVPIAGAGGDPDGNTLVSYVLQMQILENHQNGKDTHLRGIKIYAFDADAAQSGRAGVVEDMTDAALSHDSSQGFDAGDQLGDIARTLAAARLEGGETGFVLPDFMKEPEIR